MRFRVGVGNVARHLFFGHRVRHEGERVYVRFPLLHVEHRKIDRAPVKPCGSSRFEAADVESEFYQTVRQLVCGHESRGAGVLFPFPRNDAAVQINARGDDDRLAAQNAAESVFHSDDFSVFHEDIGDLALQ